MLTPCVRLRMPMALNGHTCAYAGSGSASHRQLYGEDFATLVYSRRLI